MGHGIEGHQQIGRVSGILKSVGAVWRENEPHDLALCYQDISYAALVAEAHQGGSTLGGNLGSALVKVIAADAAGFRHDDMAVLLLNDLRWCGGFPHGTAWVGFGFQFFNCDAHSFGKWQAAQRAKISSLGETGFYSFSVIGRQECRPSGCQSMKNTSFETSSTCA